MTLGEVYLWVILVAVFVCTLAIQGATTRLMFSMGRDRRLRSGACGATSARVQDAGQRGHRRRRAGRDPAPRDGQPVRSVAIAATGLIYSATSCAISASSWPAEGLAAASRLVHARRLGHVINVVALIWGGVMMINFGLWRDAGSSAIAATDLRDLSNPFINAFVAAAARS